MNDPHRSDDFAQLAEDEAPGIVREFFDFLRFSKKWWLLPIIAALLGLALFIALGGTAAAPWIYTMF